MSCPCLVFCLVYHCHSAPVPPTQLPGKAAQNRSFSFLQMGLSNSAASLPSHSCQAMASAFVMWWNFAHNLVLWSRLRYQLGSFLWWGESSQTRNWQHKQILMVACGSLPGFTNYMQLIYPQSSFFLTEESLQSVQIWNIMGKVFQYNEWNFQVLSFGISPP